MKDNSKFRSLIERYALRHFTAKIGLGIKPVSGLRKYPVKFKLLGGFEKKV